MRIWRYKRDADGRPRHFESHREVLVWALKSTGAIFGPFLGVAAVSAIYSLFTSEAPIQTEAAIVVATSVAVLWLASSAVMYLYVALSGGIMSRDERKSRNNS